MMIHREMSIVVVVGLMMPIVGCAFVSGNWRAISVAPDAGAYTIRAISFDSSGGYTATQSDGRSAETATGRYRWNLATLQLKPDDSVMRDYGCVIGWNGTMKISDDSTREPVTVTLKRARD